MKSLTRLMVTGAAAALVAGACGSGGASPTASAPPTARPTAAATPKSVTIEWWTITYSEPGVTILQTAASEYMAAHPWVTIKIDNAHMSAPSELRIALQEGRAPDLFFSWGGSDLAAQAQAGMLKDITADVAPWKDEVNAGAMSVYQYKGRQYGIPWDMGMIGFWYNKKLFAQAGITAVPTTWDEFLADVDKLKAAKIVPYALAGKDEWPGMHAWTYLVLRNGGREELAKMVETGDWNTDACKAGGAAVQALVAKNPFQPGFLGATYDKGEAAAVGNAEAAMELMGQWAPGVQSFNSKTGKGIGADLGWFAFPAVTGGKGDPNDGVGGGNGIAVGKDAPAEAVDFLHHLSSQAVGNRINLGGMGLSTTVGTEGTVSDVNLQAVLAARARAKYIQLYLDQATSPAVGAAISDATAGLFAGTSTPEQVCQAITDAAPGRL